MSKSISTFNLKTVVNSDGQQVFIQYWPTVLNGTVPDRLFTDEEKEEITVLIGYKALDAIESIACRFLLEREYYGKTTINELNKQLFNAAKHADALRRILEDQKTAGYLLNTITDNFSYDLTKRTVGSSGKLLIHSELGIIKIAAEVLQRKQKRTGRRKGQGKIAERNLVESLYVTCLTVTGKWPTNNPNGTLQQLVAILNRPLDLGGNLPGLVRQIIDERKPEKKEK